jgi:hypothetical protein
MLMGLFAWTAGLIGFGVGRPLWLVVALLGTHGLCIACFPVAGQVFVSRVAQGDVRVSVQAFLTVANGFGLLVGNVAAGSVRHLAEGSFPVTYGVAAALSLMSLTVFFIGFPRQAGVLREVDQRGAAEEGAALTRAAHSVSPESSG